MDLLQLIEGRRFLGREFLTWLWFESELLEGQMGVGGVGDFELFLEKHITLEAGKKDKEQSKLKGTQPSNSPEAREALRQGKLPTQAFVRVKRGEQEYSFVFRADTFALAGVKVPQLLKENEDDPFLDRIGHVEDVEAMVEGLYADFVLLRTTPAWAGLVLPAMLRWSRDEAGNDGATYREARATALSSARGKGARRAKAPGGRAAHPDAA